MVTKELGEQNMKRLLYCLALLVLCSLPGFAQGVPVALMPMPRPQFFLPNGTPNAGGCLFFYNAGTSTPAATYADLTGLILNTNPVILDSSGYTTVYLANQSYKVNEFTAGGVNCALGTQIWSQDNVNSPVFLGANNAWTGNQTHAGTETFNGLTNLLGGGFLAGNFGGSPIFTGTPAFNGVPAFSVANTTQITNLNAALLNGCTWAAPCAIGTGTPNTAIVTTISATGQITSTLAIGSPPFAITSTTNVPNLNVRNINGVDYPATAPAHSVPVATAANTTVTYKVVPNCPGSLSYNQSTDTFGCSTTQIATASKTTGCATANPPGSICTDTLTWSTAFADTAYFAVCSGTNVPQGVPGVNAVQGQTTTTVDVVTTNINQGNVSGQYAKINCIGVHP